MRVTCADMGIQVTKRSREYVAKMINEARDEGNNDTAAAEHMARLKKLRAMAHYEARRQKAKKDREEAEGWAREAWEKLGR